MKRIAITLVVVLFSITVYLASADTPDRPTNLVADDVSDDEIVLSWDAPDNDGGKPINGYKIERKVGAGSYSEIYTTPDNSTSYTDKNLIEDQTYIYHIFSINADGESDDPSAEAIATPKASSAPPVQIPPSPPTLLTAQAVSPTEIELDWTKPVDNNSPKIIGYKIEQRVDTNSTYAILVNNTAITSTSYTVTGVTTNSDYWFRVSALNSIGFSSTSNEASATPTETSAPEVDLVVPKAPTGVTATALSPTEILVTWKAPKTNNSPSVTSYQIEVKVSGGDFDLLEDDYGLETSYKHENLDTKYVYTYRISARNSLGLGASSSDSAQPEHTSVPSQFTAIELSPTQVRLEWNAPSDTFGQRISGYEIREQITAGVYQIVATTGGQTTSYLLSGLTTNEAYTYSVKAKFPLGSTDYSEDFTFTLTEESGKVVGLPPSKPINLQAEATSPTQIYLTWDSPASDGGSPTTGYRIDLKINVGEYFTLAQNTGSIGRTFTHTDRSTDFTYSYKVYAINEVGTGPESNIASVTPTASSVPTPSGTIPSSPQGLQANMISLNQINLFWGVPAIDGGSTISGYKIEVKKNSGAFVVLSPNTGKSTTYSHTGLEKDATYTYRVYAINAIGDSTPSNLASVTVIVEEKEPVDPKLRVAGFPDPAVDPQYYIDRYNNEPKYKEWFDGIFPEYTIYDIVGVAESVEEPPTEKEIRIEYYFNRYNSEPTYKRWFDSYFNGKTLAEVVPDIPSFGICGEGTELKDGICQIIIK